MKTVWIRIMLFPGAFIGIIIAIIFGLIVGSIVGAVKGIGMSVNWFLRNTTNVLDDIDETH